MTNDPSTDDLRPSFPSGDELSLSPARSSGGPPRAGFGGSRRSRAVRSGDPRRDQPVPGTPPAPYEPRHAGLEEDETLLPEAWTVQVRRVRAAARQDLRKLLDMTPAERRERIEEAESRRSFRSNALAEMLMDESRARVGRDPAEADDLAYVAWLVLHWVPGPPGDLWRQTGRARALAHRANAQRCAGNLAEADRTFQRLRTRVIHERLEDLRLTGEAAGWEAALRWRQGRWEEAVELLAWSVDALRRRCDRSAMAHNLEHWAEILRGAGDLERALGCLDWAARVVEPAAYTAERRRVLLHRSQLLCDAGRVEEAAAGLEESREVRRGEPEGEDPLSLDRAWLEGRLAGLRGDDVEAALRSLREVREELVEAGRTAEAALVALDGVGTSAAAAPGDGEGLKEAAAEAADWLEEWVVEGDGVPMLLAEWAQMVAGRLRRGVPAREAWAEMHRGLSREVALATWGAG